METGVAARAVEHGRLEVVEDQVARTAAEERQGIDQAPVEFSLALRQGELDVDQAAIAEHGHEHRDLAGRRAHLHAAAFAPIDLHRLGRLVMHLLVDATACRPNLAQVTAQSMHAGGVALGSTSDLLADAYGREVGILGQQFLDPIQVWIEHTGTRYRLGRWRLLHLQGGSHGVTRAVQAPRDHPAGELFDLAEAADLGPQSDLHGAVLLWSGVAAAATCRNTSPSSISPWPGSGRRLTPGAGSDST